MVQPSKSVQSVRVQRVRDGRDERVKDWVTVEEPLEIRLALPGVPQGRGRPGTPAGVESIAVTMRTPGRDFELAAGFLATEGVIRRKEDVREITYCRSGRGPQEYNIVEVRLRSARGIDLARLSRKVFTSSSCGICGKASIDAVEVQGCRPIAGGTLEIPADVLVGLPDRLREAQGDFSRTGGLHAAGLFTGGGELVSIHEDVGRHNAVDKVVGEAFLQGALPLLDRVLVVSGRTSFEILQKAVVAGIPAVVAVGAPSSLAVELAERFNLTLAGFVRRGGYNLYADGDRVR
ncbi:MAG: formate dehydrogenase accessory sulfurtransferase FdhD, partial [Gemmatimonadota bacterium]